MRGWRQRESLNAAIAAFLLAFVCGCTPLQTAAPTGQPSAPRVVEARPVQPYATAGQVDVPYFPAPTSMDLGGEPVPLTRQAVYERFDKEFTLIVYNHAQIYLWLKRMNRYFPMIEERIRHYGLPEDLKYVTIAESDLLPNACSPKGAAGPWQFMASTGAAYGLSQSRCVDNRYSFQRSTDSAFMLLKNLHDKYHSWALALAAYNAGDKRVLDAMRAEGSHDYYDLCLPLETERYVFRILAIKAVLSNPGMYGYSLPTQYGYRPEDQVTVTLPGPVSMRTIASAAGATYSEVKRLNPVFRTDEIPAGAYQITLPHGTREVFERNFKSGGSGVLLAQGGAASSYAAPAEPKSEPVRAVSHSPKQKVRAHSPGAGTAKAKAHSGRQKPHQAKAVLPKAKRKSGQAKTVSHKARGKAGHPKPNSHGAKKKGGKSLVKR